jgi:Ca2+/Na+ antiporter
LISLETQQMAMCVCAVLELLFLYELAREVNKERERQGLGMITREQYGWRFFNRIFEEHQRLFPKSSKRVLWVLVFAISVIGFIIASFF